MDTTYTIINKCRLCKLEKLINIASLGEQYITSRFPDYGDFSTPKTPIDICICDNCKLLQLLQNTDSNEMYEYEYGYMSGISNTMKMHLKKYNNEIINILKVDLKQNDLILDIGSNDSTMLSYYSNKYKRIGIDPTGLQFKKYYKDIELIPTYFSKEIFKHNYHNLKCKIITSISVLYDLRDPIKFSSDIYEILDDDGIWTTEQSYLLEMLKLNSIDTICHEHLEYYSLKQIKYIADVCNFKIIDVKFNECNGGSFRIYFSKKKSKLYDECTDLINKILKDEFIYGLYNIDTYYNFMQRCNNEIKLLCEFIDEVNNNNQSIYIYGASTKGNCLLQYANITEDKIKYAVERNPIKFGKMTSTGIKIISEEKMRINKPDYLLVLPWHFKNEIILRENEYLKNGGSLIFPFPYFSVFNYK